jgi:HAMP domain-containing protein
VTAHLERGCACLGPEILTDDELGALAARVNGLRLELEDAERRLAEHGADPLYIPAEDIPF